MRSSSCSNTRGALLATWFSVVLLGSTIGRAAASDDWLDEMPAVETVAQALARVYTDLPGTKDDDWPAANLAGTAALKKALQLTVETATFCSQVEWGGAIYQLGICNDFRFVDPIKGDSGQVSGPDMAAAYNELAAPLEQQGLKPMMVATYHSHTTGRNYLSINDINAAIQDKRVIYMTAYKEKNGVRVTQKYEPKWDHKRVDPLPRPDVLSFCGIEIPLTPQEQQRAEEAREAAYKRPQPSQEILPTGSRLRVGSCGGTGPVRHAGMLRHDHCFAQLVQECTLA